MKQAVRGIREKWTYLLFGICMMVLCLAMQTRAYGASVTGRVDYAKAASILARANAKLSAQGQRTLKMDAYLQQIALHDAAIAKMPDADEANVSYYTAKNTTEKPELKWQTQGGFGAAYKDEGKLVDEVVNAAISYCKYNSSKMTGSGTLLVGIGYITNMTNLYDAQWEGWFPEYSSTAGWCVVVGYGTCTSAPASGVETRTFTRSRTVDYSSIKKFTGSSAVKVSSLKITGSSSLTAGKSTTLKVSVSPTNATNKAVTWSSSNTKYATVSSKGVVTAKSAGAGKTVTITAKAKDGSGKKAVFKISIKKASKVKVKTIKITGKTSVLAGKKITLKAKVSPTNASNKAVTWSSSNKKYATVSSKGVVTAKAAGAGKTVTITAKAKDGSGKKATFKVKIKGAVSKITLKGSKTLKAGKSTTIKATVKVGKGGSKALSWSSSNKKYATVSSKGVVTAKKAGKGKTVTITAKAKDGSGKMATFKIKIK